LSSNDGKHFEKIFSEQNTGLILGKKFGRTIRKDFGGIFRFSGVSGIFGTAVMAMRTGRRDRGVRGIPGVVANRGAGAARDG
jgi:hypothetical protein